MDSSLLYNLISYYKFDTDANDSHGSNNGTVIGAILQPGKINDCYYFAPAGSYISMGNVLNVGTSDFTISVWIKRTATGLNKIIVSKNKNNDISDIGYHLTVSGSDTLNFDIKDVDSQFVSVTTGFTVPLDIWIHVIVNYDSSDVCSIYINNQLINSEDVSHLKSLDNTGNFYVDSKTTVPNVFLGYIDEIGIWIGRVLSVTERTTLYNNGNGLQPPFEIRNEIQQIHDYNYNLILLIQQYKDKPKFKGLVEGMNDQANDLETAIFEIRDNFWLDTAEGVQLDVIGLIVGEDRLGRSDADYRDAIKVRIVINTGSGEGETIIFAFTQFFNATIVELRNIGSANVQVTVDILITQEIFNFFLDIIVGGVGLIIITGNDHPFGLSNDITLGSETTIWGFAEDTNPTDVNAGDLQTVYTL